MCVNKVLQNILTLRKIVKKLHVLSFCPKSSFSISFWCSGFLLPRDNWSFLRLHPSGHRRKLLWYIRTFHRAYIKCLACPEQWEHKGLFLSSWLQSSEGDGEVASAVVTHSHHSFSGRKSGLQSKHMGCQLPNCAESCLELVTTGLSLEGKTSGLRTKMAHAHVHNRRDEKGNGHRVYDPLPRRVLSKPGREGEPRAWILAWESAVHTPQTGQMPRPDFRHPDIPVGHLCFWGCPAMLYPHRLR